MSQEEQEDIAAEQEQQEQQQEELDPNMEQEQEDEQEQQYEIKPKPHYSSAEELKNFLKPEQISQGLTKMSKTFDGSSYAYSNLTIVNRGLDDLGDNLRLFQHIRTLNLSKNNLKDISEVIYLPYLQHLDASDNQVDSISFLNNYKDALQFLLTLNLSKNKIKALTPIPQFNVSKLILSENEISDTSAFSGGIGLLFIDLRKNKMTTCTGLNDIRQLEQMDLSENELTNIDGLGSVWQLTKLNLSKNKISVLQNFNNVYKVNHLNLSENLISDIKAFAGLEDLYYLNQLDTQENPIVVEKGDDFKKEILIAHVFMERVKKLNDEEVTEDDVKSAKEEREERQKAEELARKEAEEKEAEEKAAALLEGAEQKPENDDE